MTHYEVKKWQRKLAETEREIDKLEKAIAEAKQEQKTEEKDAPQTQC